MARPTLVVGARKGATQGMLAVVVADGELAPEDAELARRADLVIAADGGARWLDAQGVRPDVLVGDLDSLEAASVTRLQAAGTRVSRHPVDKDASDTELAVEAAIAAGADRVVVLGALGGGRLDHELANVALLVDRVIAGVDLRLQRGATRVRAVRADRSIEIEAEVGAIVTLLPIGGDAVGVSTTGLQYPLRDEILVMGRSRGLSNVVSGAPASVTLRAGSLLVIEIDSTKEGE